MMDKEAARKKALKLRKNENKKIASALVIEAIIQSNILDQYVHIGIYYPIGNEMDIMPLLKHYADKKFYLPKTKQNLSFVQYQLGDSLIDGVFHTKEPLGEEVCRNKIECFIIPCVAISKEKSRIGYGKGYYDKYLEGYTGKKIGVCYKDCCYWDIVCDDFDVKLDMVFTESKDL